VLGVAWGAVMARARGRGGDRLAGLLAALLYALPPFWVGMMAILSLAVAWPLFPASSMHSVGAEAWPAWRRALDLVHHLALPAAVLGVSSAAGMARFVRAGLLSTVGEAFVRAARARGVGGSRLFGAHALRGALVPIVNLAGLSLPALVSGSLAVEIVFAWPGMGRLFYDGLLARDAAVVLALTALTSVLVVLGSLLADLAMAALDPRIRLGRRGSTPA
jgi:peptide/nickel transport system permease protein